jgi:hypothetical protein
MIYSLFIGFELLHVRSGLFLIRSVDIVVGGASDDAYVVVHLLTS